MLAQLPDHLRMSTSMLSISNLDVSYGPVRAVHGISLEVHKGEVVALIGPNGAGKTSTIMAIAGLVGSHGVIRFEGEPIDALATEDRVRLGIAFCPEGRRVFVALTVQENLLLGAATQTNSVARQQDIDYCFSLFPRLAERHNQTAGTLSGGEQQMLAIARALMSRPRFLVLDEPSLGLAPRIIEGIFEHIASLKASGMTILLVEQNVNKALDIADRAYVLASGRVRATGRASDLATDPQLINAYLGG
jgi:branched-chain amino acid transport system ATP-binding protein